MKFNQACWTMPWCDDKAFQLSSQRVKWSTLVAEERLWVLWQLAQQAKYVGGEVWECGVYRGGSAALIADAIRDVGPVLRLFDTFTGIPRVDKNDNQHQAGDFNNTNVEDVKKLVSYDMAETYIGVIPDTFKGLENSCIAFCHVDVDVYQSVKDCCEFVWPRLEVGGIMVFDDYDAPSCAGARLAVDEFFMSRNIHPIIIKDKTTASGVVFKSF